MTNLQPPTLVMLKSLHDCYLRQMSGKPSHLYNTKNCLGLIKRGMLEIHPYANGGFIKHTLRITREGRQALEPFINQ
ncbi:MAG: hypothetical protein ABI091_24970, partial [Ferruginibacter sp.]